MEGLTLEEVQEQIDLTPEQEKAWKSFVRAVKKCKKVNIYFYQVLETIGALNGNNVEDVQEQSSKVCQHIPSHIFVDERNLNWELRFPTISVCDGWADDDHHVQLKTD